MGSTALPILQSLPEGSSGRGISYYSQAIRCARKLHLDEQSAGGASAGRAADVGKIFHALCEIYFNTKHRDIVVELSDTNLGEASDEARRLFSAYSARFSPDDFARVVATELLLPRNDEESSLVASAVGVSPFTCRLDMVVEVDARSADLLYTKRGLILTPGIYLWDFKTKGQKGSNDDLQYRYSDQGTAYQLVWNALHPTTPALGMVFDIVVAHKKLVDGSFYSVHVPAVGPEQAEALRSFLREGSRCATGNFANHLSCFEFGRACPHLLSGACNRI